MQPGFHQRRTQNARLNSTAQPPIVWTMSDRILISGANRGIGLALCRELVRKNHRVFAGARNPAQAGELKRLAAAAPNLLTIVQLDVDDQASVQAAATRVAAERAALDALVNNAGVFPEEGDESIEEIPLEWFDQAFHTNVVGSLRVSRAMLPMLRVGRNPRIVNLGSGAGSISNKSDHRRYCYGASKAALHYVTRAMAAELAPLIVTAISPGWVRTDMGGANAELGVEESAAALASTLLALQPEDSSQFLDRHGRHGQYQW